MLLQEMFTLTNRTHMFLRLRRSLRLKPCTRLQLRFKATTLSTQRLNLRRLLKVILQRRPRRRRTATIPML